MSHMTLARLCLQHINGAESKVIGSATIYAGTSFYNLRENVDPFFLLDLL